MASSTDSAEIKPSFTWKYILLFILLLLITNTVTYFTSELFKEEKVIDTFTSSSQNLAATPETAAGKLEIFLSLSSNQKELIKSLFRYEITIKNNSSEGIDNFTVTFLIPPGVNLIPNPEINSNPPDLMKVLKINEFPDQNNQHKYEINLLNEGEGITFAYLGYSGSLISAEPMKAIIHKKKIGYKMMFRKWMN